MLPRLSPARRTLVALTALATSLGLATWAPGAGAVAPERGAAATSTVAPTVAPTAVTARAKRKPVQPLGPTIFQIASINLLGSGHTDGNGPRKAFADSGPRMTLTKQVIDQEGVDVIGFQEMHDKQIDMWNTRYGSAWGLYPGRQVRYPAGHNSITWRKGAFDLVQARTLDMPYFKGQTYKMPYVQLRDRTTKQLIWVSNVHLPANTHGDAQRFRDEGIKRQAALVKRLRAESPGVPVYLTGDMNDRVKFFCPMLTQAPLRAANGGAVVGSTCTPPAPMDVDWVLGTADSTFSAFRARDDEIVDRASDHPFIIANATIPTARARRSPIRHVVVVAVDGLRSTDAKLGSAEVPQLTWLKTKGASTYNARTTAESTLPMPNLTSVLTGRPVAAAYDGHRVATDVDSGGTVHDTAGHYVSSVFDMAHNNGLRTAFFSSQPRSSMLVRTWSEAGGRDPYWVDNGTNKLDLVGQGTDGHAAAGLTAALRSATPPALSVLELADPERVGLVSGFGSDEHRAAVRRTDAVLGSVLQATRVAPALKGRTLVVLVGTSGGAGTTNSDPARFGNYQVPFFAWGPGVAAGKDLYALNPAWRNPGGARGGYRPGGPVRVASAANLALAALRLPALPGSTINADQALSVWGP